MVITRTDEGWLRAYVVTFPHGLSTITTRSLLLRKLGQDAVHLHRRHRGIPSLVPVLPPCTIERLGHGLRRQHAERHRYAGLEPDLLHASGTLPGNVVEMRRLAPDHRAQAHHGVVSARRGEALRRQRDLERP